MNNIINLLILIAIVIILIIILFLSNPRIESFSFTSNTNSPCILKNDSTLPPIPLPTQIPLSSSNSDTCIEEIPFNNFTPCFNSNILVGIPIQKQSQADTNAASIQIVNGSNQIRWFYWSTIEALNGPVQVAWSNLLSINNIPFSTWQKDETLGMGIFQLENKQNVVLSYIGIGTKFTPVTDCPDNLSLNNLVDGQDFYDKCWVSNDGLQMPKTEIEWTYSPNDSDIIKISAVNGFSRPCRIEYLDNQKKYQDIVIGDFSKPGCMDCKGRTFPTRPGLINSCHVPCSENNTSLNKISEKDYCSPTNCYSNNEKTTNNTPDNINSPEWCPGVKKFFSLNTEDLGNCYSFKQVHKEITNYERVYSRIKMIFC